MQRVSFEVPEYHYSNIEEEKSSEIVPVGGSLPLTNEDPAMENLGNAADEESSMTGEKLDGWVKRVAPDVSNKLKRLKSSVFGGDSKETGSDRSKPRTGRALKGLKFISKIDGEDGWPAVEKRFRKITAKTDGLLLRSQFGECIGMKSKDFALVLFDALARRQNLRGDVINVNLLKEFWEQISDQDFDSRLMTFFDMMDKDGNGRLTEDEVKKIISLSSSANRLSSIQKKSEEYAAMIMEELDPHHMGYILVDSLKTLLLQAETQTETAPLNSEERMEQIERLSGSLSPTRKPNPLKIWYRKQRLFVQGNWQRIWVIAVWITIMAILFTYKYIQYKNRQVYQVLGHCVCLAKGAAETLKLNMALILFPVCRNTITWLRNKTRFGSFVPFDDNINFHKVIALGITTGVIIHSVAHLACDFPRLIAATPEEYKPLGKFFGEKQPRRYIHFVKSTEGITGLVMVLLMAIAFTLALSWFRRGTLRKKLSDLLLRLKKLVTSSEEKPPEPLKKPDTSSKEAEKKYDNFNAFWYTHHLFIIVYILLIIHGYYLYLTKEWYKKTTWMYLAVPVALYACERLTRVYRSSIKTVEVHRSAIYPGEVLTLEMSKPTNFKYKSGQYMFVNCPAVSPFEWHPFSITSTPKDNHLSVHIRALGDWTRAIKRVFSEVSKPPRVGDMLPRANKHDCPKIMIDGPYGAPAQDYRKYEVVLLIGLGIGATPMISIIKDIIHNTYNKEQLSQMEKGSKTETFKTRKAYFYWSTSEQGTFDWFKNIMNEIAERDINKIIELHNHCTSVFEEGDVRSALIRMLQSIYYKKNNEDVVSGTRVMSHFARPNWREVYKRIALRHPDANVGVFYCGAPTLTKELRHLASDFTLKTNTTFSFHKENF